MTATILSMVWGVLCGVGEGSWAGYTLLRQEILQRRRGLIWFYIHAPTARTDVVLHKPCKKALFMKYVSTLFIARDPNLVSIQELVEAYGTVLLGYVAVVALLKDTGGIVCKCDC
jgi:hypothetical protein